MIKQYLLLLSLASVLNFPTEAKETQSSRMRIGILAGLNYNQLFWSTPDDDAHRLAFSLKPNFDLFLKIPVLKRIGIEPFIGYHIFGGRSKKKDNGYQDEYFFYSMEYGTHVFYQNNSYFYEIGFKVNKHNKVLARYYGSLTSGAMADGDYIEDDWTDYFPKYSGALGLSVKYDFFKYFLLGADFWFGITDLLKNSIFGQGGATGRNIEYRVLVGFLY